MPQVLHPKTTIISSKDGEVKVEISLELTINLNSDGLVVSNQSTKKEEVNNTKTEEKPNWVVPEFSSSVNKITFGKSE